MTPAIILLHSPFVGPLTWQPVADELVERGHTTYVPSLLAAGQAPPPFWPHALDAVNTCVADLPEDQQFILISHSNAGLFNPLIAAQAHRHVAGCVFADALVPPDAETVPTMPTQLAGPLEARAVDGLLPAWTNWFDDDAVAALFPDEQTRLDVTAEQPQLPVSYCRERVPVPAGWDQRPCGYLQFSEAYDNQAQRARQRGWPVRHLPGQHLHQLVCPAAVTDGLLEILQRLGID